jgi:hypothetical protein
MPQDFSHQNLRGRSFKGQDLTGANFSYSDIRGASFTNAILRNTKFIDAKAGLQPCWADGLLIGSILLATVSGFTSALVGGLAGIGLTGLYQLNEIFISAILLITLAVFCILTICKGLAGALETIFWAMALLVTVYAAAALVVAIAIVVMTAEPSAVAQSWTRVEAVGRSVITVGATALTLAIVMILFAARPSAVAQAWTVAGANGRTVVAVWATLGAVAGGAWVILPVLLIANLTIEPIESPDMMPVPVVLGIVAALTGALAGTVAVARLSDYIRWRFLAGDAKHEFVWRVAIALAAIGGTKFRGADLTDADFTEATLENTDFRRATLTGICWFQSKQLFSTRF